MPISRLSWERKMPWNWFWIVLIILSSHGPLKRFTNPSATGDGRQQLHRDL